jgi:lipoprotein-anchoring transpeptidase ErfK/SrfK
MRRTPIIISVVGLVLVLVLAGSVYAYDSSRSDTIAKGVKVGAVDVGGLTTAAAKAKLRARYVAQLQRPLVLVAGETEFPLSAREAKIQADVDDMVADAVKRGREGWIVTRTWRGVTGAKVKATVAPDVAYSEAAVRRIVDKVRVKMTRKPVEADISVRGHRVEVKKSRIGLSVDAKALRPRVEQALVADIDANRAVRVPLEKRRPKVTTKRLAKKYPVVLTVDRTNFRISLYKKLKKVVTYPIAVGMAGLETPAGRYTIQNKAINPAWSVPNSPWAGSLAGTVIPGGAPNNPLIARWLGVADGVGVHGTSDRGSMGSNASHGCIRMLPEDVIKLYDQVPVGTPIFIN